MRHHSTECRYRLYRTAISWALLLASSCSATAQTISFKKAAGSPVPAGSGPSGVVTADFNNDGKMDFAVVDSTNNSVSVFLSNGDGTFTTAPHSPFTVNGGILSGSVPIAMAVGDFSGDGKQDLAITNIPINLGCRIGGFFGSKCAAGGGFFGEGGGAFLGGHKILSWGA